MPQDMVVGAAVENPADSMIAFRRRTVPPNGIFEWSQNPLGSRLKRRSRTPGIDPERPLRYQERAVRSTRFFCHSSRTLFSVFALVAAAQASDRWVTLKDCRYLPNPANDADSFHVRAGGREYIFRLYFVDSPETDASLPKRIAEQAKYFGVSAPQALQIGLEAERFSRQELARPFTVRTCKQDARGRSRLKRYFAFIQTDRADLGEPASMAPPPKRPK